VYRVERKHHVGFVVRAETPEKVEALVANYQERILRDYHAVLPPADRPVA